jgi:cysteinyl-tRNA synthetase, unknown class
MKLIATLPLFLLLCFAVWECKPPEKEKAVKQKDVNVNAAEKMQKFVIGISDYAKKHKSDFLIIPQNGVELAFKQADYKSGVNEKYLAAIDGLAVEELFYYETLNIDSLRLLNLRKLKRITVLNSDFVKEDSDVADAKERNKNEGFVPFVRTESNYHYHKIPDFIPNKNFDDVTKIGDIKNYLYLINPQEYDSREEYVAALAKTDYDLVTVDLFFDKYNPLTPEQVAKLKKKSNGSKRLVVCYMNIGAAENWRYYWNPNWKLGSPAFLKKPYEGYENEIYVEYWNPAWQKIIYGNDDSYLKKIIDAGFDGVYLDNTEAYYELYRKE